MYFSMKGQNMRTEPRRRKGWSKNRKGDPLLGRKCELRSSRSEGESYLSKSIGEGASVTVR